MSRPLLKDNMLYEIAELYMWCGPYNKFCKSNAYSLLTGLSGVAKWDLPVDDVDLPPYGLSQSENGIMTRW